jgi:hypothetical protein
MSAGRCCGEKTAAIPCERAPLGIAAMRHGKDFMVDDAADGAGRDKLARLDRAARREMLGVADRIDPPGLTLYPADLGELRERGHARLVASASLPRRSIGTSPPHEPRIRRAFENAGGTPQAGSGVSLDVGNGWRPAVPQFARL